MTCCRASWQTGRWDGRTVGVGFVVEAGQGVDEVEIVALDQVDVVVVR